mgnify:CR=1 FL=1
MKEQEGGLCDLQRYRMALDTLNLYSKRVDDIFIFIRIMLEVQYAELLLINECCEESLEMFLLASKHLSILYDLPDGCILNGSVSLLDTVSIVITGNDKYEKCIFNIGRYEKDPRFDKIREDKRFSQFMESLNKFFPSPNCRSWMNEKGNDNLDVQWQILLDRAKKEAILSPRELLDIAYLLRTVSSLKRYYSGSHDNNALNVYFVSLLENSYLEKKIVTAIIARDARTLPRFSCFKSQYPSNGWNIRWKP